MNPVQIIKQRWQPEKREDSPIYQGDIVTADNIYTSARNDILDLLDAIDNQESELAACRGALRLIADYETPDDLRKSAEDDYGLDYEEALEMAYENIQEEARSVLK